MFPVSPRQPKGAIFIKPPSLIKKKRNMAKHQRSKDSHDHHSSHKRANYNMTKKLIIAVIAVFVLIISSAVFLFRGGVGEKDELAVSVQCASFCETGQKSAFCDLDIKVTEIFRSKCSILAGDSKYAKYNVQACQTISCEKTKSESDESCKGIGGVWEAPATNGECEQLGDSKRFDLVPTNEPPITGQICCTPIEYFD
ncbi:MAG: hypothetical protein KKC19_02090 [Nanoarchaeota archaeon]|nr:hypothetical protein [Nanoarchaeota archaeon]